MTTQNTRKAVITDFNQECNKGLLETKIFQDDVKNVTRDHSYVESHKLNTAIASDHTKPLPFTDPPEYLIEGCKSIPVQRNP